MATLASRYIRKKKINDTNIVKIAMTKCKKNIFRAIYFSRTPIPYNSKNIMNILEFMDILLLY